MILMGATNEGYLPETIVWFIFSSPDLQIVLSNFHSNYY